MTYLGQYLALQIKLGCQNLQEMQSQLVGVSGITLAGVLAAYTFGIADAADTFDMYATISALTLLEITAFLQSKYKILHIG